MNKKSGQQLSFGRIAGASIILLSLLVWSAPAQFKSSKRFRAVFETFQTGPPVVSPRCAAPTLLVSFTGSGVATRLGRVTVDASHCIIDDPAEPDFTNGLMVISNARGQLFGQYSGTDTAGSLDGSFFITGGSGAYAGASGEGTLSGMALAEEERGFVMLEGRIALP